MNVVFRVDASLSIGTGHVMRCLTLADELSGRGAVCDFIGREQPGSLEELIKNRGHNVHLLPEITEILTEPVEENGVTHAHWLLGGSHRDAQETGIVLDSINPDWLIIDHYGIDFEWEAIVSGKAQHCMVLDDLADRKHLCDFLLDQNLGRNAKDYEGLVPEHCELEIGPASALLRPEFSELREYSLNRRASADPTRLLVTMGGIDQLNVTSRILRVLDRCPLPEDSHITVVLGQNAPWIEKVKELARSIKRPTTVLINTPHMARLMAEADLVIGAGGSTSWERCCLGVPAILVILAENQRGIGEALAHAGAVMLAGSAMDDCLEANILDALVNLVEEKVDLGRMAVSAASLTDGKGVEKIAERVIEK